MSKEIQVETPEEKEVFDAINNKEDIAINWDGEDLPPIGFECECSYSDGGPDDWCDWHGPSKLIAVHGDMCWVAHYGAHHRLHHIGSIEFRPIETPEQKEIREREYAISQMPTSDEEDVFERLFWEYDSELKNCDSKRMLFKKYLGTMVRITHMNMYEAGYRK